MSSIWSVQLAAAAQLAEEHLCLKFLISGCCNFQMMEVDLASDVCSVRWHFAKWVKAFREWKLLHRLGLLTMKEPQIQREKEFQSTGSRTARWKKLVLTFFFFFFSSPPSTRNLKKINQEVKASSRPARCHKCSLVNYSQNRDTIPVTFPETTLN